MLKASGHEIGCLRRPWRIAILGIAECLTRHFPPPEWGGILIGWDA